MRLPIGLLDQSQSIISLLEALNLRLGIAAGLPPRVWGKRCKSCAAASQGLVMIHDALHRIVDRLPGFLFGLAYGYYTSTFNVVAMDLCDPRIAASMFAIFMMFINLGTVGGQALGGVLTENLGFSVMVLIMGALNLVNIGLVIVVFRRRDQQQATANSS